jgi:hypothetical protein
MLLADGLISRQQLDRATFLQATRGGTIDYHLIGAGAFSSERLVRFLVRRFPVVHWPRKRFENLAQHVVESISPRLAATLRIVPLARSGNTLVLGLTDPSRHHAIQEASHYSGTVIQPVVVSHKDMNWALRRYYPSTAGELTDEEVPVPLTKRVTREFEAAAAEGAPEPAHAIPLVTKSDPTAARPAPPSPTPPGEEVVMRKAVVLGEQAAPVAPRSEPGPVVTDPFKKVGLETKREIPSSKPAPPTDSDSWSRPISKAPARRPRRSAFHPLSRPAAARSKPEIRSTARKVSGPPPAERKPPEPVKPAEEKPRERTEGELIAAIGKAPDRDQIIDLAMEYLLRFAGRAVFFVVKSNEIRGFHITGKLTNREAIRSFWIPTSSPSTLRKVVTERKIHHGPLGDSPADAVLAAALGGRPERAVIAPVAIRDRVVGLLFADRLEIESPPWNRLERLAETVAENLARLISRSNRP